MMQEMDTMYAVEEANTVQNHVDGGYTTEVRWRLAPDQIVPLTLAVPADKEPRPYVVTKITFVVTGAADGTKTETVMFTGYPVSARKHRPLIQDSVFPVGVPVDDPFAAMVDLIDQATTLECFLLEPVKVPKVGKLSDGAFLKRQELVS